MSTYHLSNHAREQMLSRNIPMQIKYDQTVDVLYVRVSDAPIEESVEIEPGLIVDVSENGDVTGVEVLRASHRLDIPRNLPFVDDGFSRFMEGVNKKIAVVFAGG